MAFIDEIILKLKAGDGGDGVVNWHRSRREQKGGPAGGNGGKGGNVYLVGVRDIEYLAKYTSDPKFVAEDGGNGGGKSLEGKDGDDLLVKVPVGSLVTNLTTGEQYDITNTDRPIKVLSGGRGGYGNEHFKGSRNVTPMEQTDGKQGESAGFKIELRLIADAGFIGFPNVGKSTLLNTLTNSKAKIGNYAFTTLNPNLGVLDGYILADIPCLIEGASSGKGLGDKFLRHIMRTKTLVHCISVERDDIVDAYEAIRKELLDYDKQLLDKREMVVITKSDMLSQKDLLDLRAKLESHIDDQVLTVSILDDGSVDRLHTELLKKLAI
jgi:GTP-binding protein